MSDAYIYDHVRTPRGRGRANGALHEVPPIDVASVPLRNHFDTRLVGDVIFGVVQPNGEQGGNLGRQAVLRAGYDQSVPGQQLNRFCSSGLDAVNAAAAQVMAGQAELTIGGGVECMSRVPMGSESSAWSDDPIFTYESYFAPQGIGADLVASKWGYSRLDVDRYALASQQRASHAWEAGYFSRSVVPVTDELGQVLLDRDEYMRPETTAADLAALKPAFTQMGELGGYDGVALQRYPEVFAIEHVHTAGNSSGIVDGAAAVLIGNSRIGRKLGIKPRARIRAFASIGSEPTIMLTGPAPSAERALKRARMTAADIDLFELNEAFASVVLRFMDALSVPHDRINVNGGAIAMGHPLGATGAMILGTVLDELERTGKGTALVTLCVGLGMGTATIIERL